MFSLEEHDPKVTSKAAGQKLVFFKMVDIIHEVCIFKKNKNTQNEFRFVWSLR